MEAMVCGSPGQGNHLEVVLEGGAWYDLGNWRLSLGEVLEAAAGLELVMVQG